jgi:hypothetical protein
MLGMDRKSNGWRAYALELWVESRERSLMTCASATTASPELGFVEQAERDRYVAGRLRHRAAIDRVEAAELWRCHSNSRDNAALAPDSSRGPPLRFVHRREVPVGFMRTNAAQIAAALTCRNPSRRWSEGFSCEGFGRWPRWISAGWDLSEEERHLC